MKLHGVCIQTHHIDEMVDFYEKIFGYKATVDGGVDYRFLNNQLIIYKLSDTTTPSTKAVALIYNANDVDIEFERLMKLNIAKDSPTNKPWGVRSFLVYDPDGNTVSFFKNL